MSACLRACVRARARACLRARARARVCARASLGVRVSVSESSTKNDVLTERAGREQEGQDASLATRGHFPGVTCGRGA